MNAVKYKGKAMEGHIRRQGEKRSAVHSEQLRNLNDARHVLDFGLQLKLMFLKL